MVSLRRALVGLAGLALCGFAACTDDPRGIAPGAPNTAAQATPPGPRMRRLLARQYVSSVALLLGNPAALAATPPSDPSINGYTSIAASQLALNDGLVADYETSARAVAAVAVQDHERIASYMPDCTARDHVEPSCFRTFVTSFGRMAWRRPLVTEEIDDYLAVATSAARAYGSFDKGIEFAIAAFLQSPNFLFQIEVGEVSQKRRRLTDHEIAARMSFFLLDTTPSAELLARADAGELATEEQVREAALELVETPAARLAVGSFFREYLAIDGLPTLAKDPNVFPAFSSELAGQMGEETLRVIEDVVWTRDAAITELLTTEQTYLTPELASWYGIDLAGAQTGFRPHELSPETGRRGILTHGSVLATQAHTNSTSATFRGLFVMERFLCQTMPAPPPDVDTELPPSSTAPTMRDRIAVHLEAPLCRSCHLTADTLGLTFEQFDAGGRYRLTENDVTIDPSGDLDKLGTWADASELGAVLAGSSEVTACMLRNLYRHATGHVEVDGEEKALETLHENFEGAGFRFKALLVELVASDTFRHVGLLDTEEDALAAMDGEDEEEAP